MRLEFSTKARTLELLQTRLKTAKLLPLQIFSVSDWFQDQQACIEIIRQAFSNQSLIIRSSSSREDKLEASNAGAFLSIQNVKVEKIEEAVNKVVGAFRPLEQNDEILIQPMLTNVIRSGVAFSHDPNTCSPYRVINWSKGKDTTAVTGGKGGKVWFQAANFVPPYGSDFLPVYNLINELLDFFGRTPIDCEFAVTAEVDKNNVKYEELWLLQARPLILAEETEPEKNQTDRLTTIEATIKRLMRPQPFLPGKRTIFGVMPDWNPAEIIGIRPKPLSLSLYRELVTDSIWAYQRHNYGYRNLRSFPLMKHFLGLPYIDVRLSFNSFIPSDLDNNLASQLVDYYTDRLIGEPALHDKVEFEIVLSCYSLDLPKKIESLKEAGFSDKACKLLTVSLRELTNRIINPKTGLWQKDAEKLDILDTRRKTVMSSDFDILTKIYWLVEDAKRYGTLPFAGLARAGFIAVQILKSLVSIGILNDADYQNFMASISTVSRQMMRDRCRLDKLSFLELYGHLRPGSYDILSKRYDEAPDQYFDWKRKPEDPGPNKKFSLTSSQEKQIKTTLDMHGLLISPTQLIQFIKLAIELRETAKYYFTHNLSDALALIDKLGVQFGFNREDLAFSNINIFKELHVSGTNPKEFISRSIVEGKELYADTKRLMLPPVIIKSSDIWAFEWPETEPNFITQKQAIGIVRKIDSMGSLEDAIVCIPNADPGFDWLFSHGIAGLVTAWGGPNSHMAIRAGELGLPAVIGTGETSYNQYSNADKLFIDCSGRRIEVLS